MKIVTLWKCRVVGCDNIDENIVDVVSGVRRAMRDAQRLTATIHSASGVFEEAQVQGTYLRVAAAAACDARRHSSLALNHQAP
jgi:hypothetical protein